MFSLRLAILLFLPLLGLRAFELQPFMQQTQHIKQSQNGLTILWWIPADYWEESLKNGGLTDAQRKEFVAVLKPYTVLAVVKATQGVMGTLQVAPRAEMLDQLDLFFEDKTLRQARADETSPEMKNLLLVLKPLLANMLGQLGQGVEFVLYPNTNPEGKIVIDPRKPGKFEAKFYGETYRWRLPVAALLPDMVDAKSGEHFPGNYKFNPFTGDKLAPAK